MKRKEITELGNAIFDAIEGDGEIYDRLPPDGEDDFVLGLISARIKQTCKDWPTNQDAELDKVVAQADRQGFERGTMRLNDKLAQARAEERRKVEHEIVAMLDDCNYLKHDVAAIIRGEKEKRDETK